jgi:hypothetical protein
VSNVGLASASSSAGGHHESRRETSVRRIALPVSPYSFAAASRSASSSSETMRPSKDSRWRIASFSPLQNQARPETFHNFSSALHIGISDVKRQYSSLVGSSDATYAPCDHPLQCFAQSTIGAIMSRYAPFHLPAAPQLRAVLTRGLGTSYA